MSAVPNKREVLAALQLPGVRFAGTGSLDPVGRLVAGIRPFDELLGGGLPRGHLSEIVGAPSSGCTALMHALLAAATRRGEVSAVVDLPDALDPATLARAGADLERVLWVRAPSVRAGLQCADLILAAGGFALVVLDLGFPPAHRLPPHVWPRLVRRARQAGTALTVVAAHRVAGSYAAVSVSLARRQVCWSGRLFEGLASRAVLARCRLGTPGRAVTLAFGDGPRRAGVDAGVDFEERQPLGGVEGKSPLRPVEEPPARRAGR